MKRGTIFLTLVLVVLLLAKAGAQESGRTNSLAEKEVFTAGYPKTLSFRRDRMLLNSTFSNWETRHIHFDGITKKYLNEEVDMSPVAAQWANDYAKKYPGKLMLVHLNGEGRSVNDPATFKLYFPGHWVYEQGTIPVQEIRKDQTRIRVKDASPFSLKAYTVHGQNVSGEFEPHDVLLVKVDENGNRIWDQVEYASLVNIDYENQEIELKRGQHGSQPQDFSQQATYIAPVAGDIWAGNLMYYYNLSSSCPPDQNGHTAADVFVREMKTWFGEEGLLSQLDGIGFDVNYFEVKHDTWDCDNDGKVDNGMVKGRNIWREGDIDFLQKIRDAFGPEFIITADGWRDDMQRAVGILNGMETEGLCRWNDGFRQISRTINQHMYWNLHNGSKYKFSYVTSKLRNPADKRIADQLWRMGLGLATCLGVAYAPRPDLDIPEILGGQLNQANWLGQAVGPMKYVLTDQKDLLRGAGLNFKTDFVEQFEFADKRYSVEAGQLIIAGSGVDRRKAMAIPGPELKVVSGDILILLEAKAIEGFVDLDEKLPIPRKISIKLEGLPEYAEEPMRGHLLYKDLAGFMGTDGYTPLMFYFRNVGGADLRMIFEVEEQGKFAIRNLQVFNSSCLLSREFENGVVLVNPSFESVNINLNEVFSKKRKYRRLPIASTSYQSQKIKNNTTVRLPSLDALFLLKY